jgi:hypothetical protein
MIDDMLRRHSGNANRVSTSVFLAAFIVALAVPSASEETAGFQVSIGRMTI